MGVRALNEESVKKQLADWLVPDVEGKVEPRMDTALLNPEGSA